ncbi:MAG TPA: MtrB/PioB family decaheme-associated outer membrane protein, partial [Burkholderiaceae bacterium]|nr:MtrB/PioB family decaheme-associated outer membrane protein [Burkholderiaceae bacterium]
PFEKEGRSGSVQGGVIGVSDDSQKFGDFTGLNKKGAYLDLSGDARYRSDNGVYGRLEANDLGLDTRSIYFDGGREGLYTLKLGYAEIPRFQADGAQTPFLGNGGSRLTLPAGFPAATTAAMPLSTSLQPIDVESKRQRFDAGLGWLFGDQWSTQLTYRRDVRDGMQRISGSFLIANASQMVAPLDQTTDQLELSATYATQRLQATLAYQLSVFREGESSLTWSNPFTAVAAGADTGQLALAPGNQFQQLVGSLGYEITPTIRFSGDIAFGRMTQDESFLPATVNATLAPTVPALPAQSLQGDVATFNASARVTAKPMDRLNLTGSYDRNARDNKTPSLSYPAVITDAALGTTPRTNQPFSFFQDRFKVAGDYRWPASVKTSLGVDWDSIERSLQEVVTTRETTLWARMEGRATDNVLLQAKLAHADRNGTTYGIVTSIDPPQNQLMRKFYLADRKRDSIGGRVDVTAKEGVTFGLNADYAKDDYSDTTIGLTQARTYSVGGDFSAALSDQTQLYGFIQAEQIKSDQAGSQLFAAPDWTGRNEDRTQSLGFGVKQLAMGGKLELSADAVFTRMKNDITVDAGVTSPPFPTITANVDRFRLKAVYQLQKNLSLVGSWWYEKYDSADWHLDGVSPATISNLLAFGDQAPQYRVNVLQFAVRYRF